MRKTVPVAKMRRGGGTRFGIVSLRRRAMTVRGEGSSTPPAILVSSSSSSSIDLIKSHMLNTSVTDLHGENGGNH